MVQLHVGRSQTRDKVGGEAGEETSSGAGRGGVASTGSIGFCNRLLLRSKRKTESKSSNVGLQKVKGEPMLIKQEAEQKEVKVEEVIPYSAGASTGGQTLSTPRGHQPEEIKPTQKPFLQSPATLPSPIAPGPTILHTQTQSANHLHIPPTVYFRVFITLHHLAAARCLAPSALWVLPFSKGRHP